VWNTNSVVNDGIFPDIIGKYNIKDIFLSVSSKKQDYGSIEEFIKKNQTLNFYALGSTNEFALHPENAGKYIEQIATFNQNSSNMFRGIHFDVEPNGLSQFKTNRDELLLSYLDMCQISRKKTQENNLEFGLSIPYWYKTKNREISLRFNGKKKPVCHHLIDLTDHVSIMAYRERIPKIIESVEEEFAYGGNIYVAALKLELIDQLEYELTEKYSTTTTNGKLAGIAIHHYHALKKLIHK